MTTTASMTDKTSQEDTERADYVAGLRTLADVLESNPQLRLPLRESFAAFCKDRDELHAWMGVIPGRKDKDADSSSSHLRVGGEQVFGPHGFHAWIEREQVCTRVVTGTREVVKTVPIGTKEVTVTEEIIDWQCEPILAEATS